MKGDWETLGGADEQIFGAHLTSALLIQRRERCIVYRFPPVAARCDAIPSPVDRRFAYAQPPACCILNHFDSLELFLTHRHHPYGVTKSRCS